MVFHGLYQCILGRWGDLRPDTDSDGEDKTYAGADYGAFGMYRCCAWGSRLYEPFQKYAGAGASVPLLGFGNVLWKGVKEAVMEEGLLGIFKGGLTAGSAGTCAALVFGYFASLIFDPKMKK